MRVVDIRELRQNASELVRRAEEGEEITVSVSGRPSVRLVPVTRARWRAWTDLAGLYNGTTDSAWQQDHELIAGEALDPWERP